MGRCTRTAYLFAPLQYLHELAVTVWEPVGPPLMVYYTPTLSLARRDGPRRTSMQL